MRKKVVVIALSAVGICACIPLSIYESKVSPGFRDQVKLYYSTIKQEKEWRKLQSQRGDLELQIAEAKSDEIDASIAVDKANARDRHRAIENLSSAQRFRQGLETAQLIDQKIGNLIRPSGPPVPTSDEIAHSFVQHTKTVRDRIILYHVETAAREVMLGSQCFANTDPKADQEPCLSHYRNAGTHQKIIDRAVGGEPK